MTWPTQKAVAGYKTISRRHTSLRRACEEGAPAHANEDLPGGEERDVVWRDPLDLQALHDEPAAGEVDAGLIIHEGRFTYQGYGLVKLLDLGEWWEAETGLPIPLGCILAKRSLGEGTIKVVEYGIRDSIIYARSHNDETKSYIKCHAQEMEDSVIEGHIGLYVNDFSLDMGEEGERAVEVLFERAMAKGIIPGSYTDLFR